MSKVQRALPILKATCVPSTGLGLSKQCNPRSSRVGNGTCTVDPNDVSNVMQILSSAATRRVQRLVECSDSSSAATRRVQRLVECSDSSSAATRRVQRLVECSDS